ncbi:MAG TPA: sigma-70 family RNA polymerase sigma factor [Bryobacteraceae bacterium]|jgi:RNA polymerase sigma-70 factor (ECF subfamily)|nr:sigma-70 family RNA polymerase sigma factor [Bryobacteraceae bacterium]
MVLTERERFFLVDQNKLARFEFLVMPHRKAAYNLARWLTRNDHDAEDVVQEAFMRAFRFFDGFHGGDSKAWLLTIVRNSCHTWMQQNRKLALEENIGDYESTAPSPEAVVIENVDREALRRAIEELPAEFREAIVLRELEGLSYKEIGAVTGVPVGTVMSRLARARGRLARALGERKAGGLA